MSNINRLMRGCFQPLSSGTSFLRSLPYIAAQLPVRLRDTAGEKGEYSQRTEKIKRPFKATHLILSLCIATIDIGGSARRAKGLKQNLQESQ